MTGGLAAKMADQQVHAATYDELVKEIDAAIEEISFHIGSTTR